MRVAISLAIAAALLVGCSADSAGDSSAPVASELPFIAPPTVAVEPADPPVSPPASLKVTFTSLPAVRHGARETAKVKTVAGASCSIDVEYKSGPAKASDLGAKKASASGIASWTWTVGAHTTAGSWPVTVTCSKGEAAGEATKDLIVR